MKFSILVLFVLLSQFGCAQHYVISDENVSQKQFIPNEQVYIYEDIDEDLTFQQVSHPDFQNRFKPRKQEDVYQKSSNVWIRFSIQNSSNKTRKLVLYANDWDIQFFCEDDCDSFPHPQGVLVKTYNNRFYSGEDADGKIVDDLMPYATKTYFVKTKGFLQDLAFKDFDFVAVGDRKSADSRSLFDLWSIGIYSGVLLLILFGNFYLMGSSFKKSYLLYAFYSICHLFFFTGYYQIPVLFSFQWPFSHSLFLPMTAILYIMFLNSYLSLAIHHKTLSSLFKGYALLGFILILALLYFNATDMVTYYKILPSFNKTNFFFIFFSTFFLIKIPGKLKYFVFTGTLFMLSGSLITWITQYNNVYAQTFFYSIAGNALEKIVFLFGIFYLYNQEQTASRVKLMNTQKQLELSRQQLENFSNSIKEKNRLIETFGAQVEHSKVNQSEKQDYIKQLTQSIILTEEDWDNFKVLFEEVYPDFFFALKQSYTQVTQAEIRLIALLKLNLNNKEIGGMLGISPESVIKTKYRLKKKLAKTKQGDLSELLEEF